MRTLLLLPLLISGAAAAEISPKVIEQAKDCVVSVERRTTVAFSGESAGRARATGFVVDLAAGIIATNRHVTGTSPASFAITARDGRSAEARPLYYDPFSDLAFLKVSTAALAGARQAVFAPPGSPSEGEPVFLVGNNEGYPFSVKTGTVVNARVHKGRRHDLNFQTSFDRTGGSSGSPVFNSRGEVAGMHASGSDTSSFELRAAYVQDALYALRAGAMPRRGDPLVRLAPVGAAEAERSGRLPRGAAGAQRRLLAVETSAGRGLKAGDIVMAVDGVRIGDDAYLFDKLMNNKAGSSAEAEVYRGGRKEKVPVEVADAEAGKVNRFLTFCGALFTPYTAEEMLASGDASEGVLLVSAEKGSPFRMPRGKNPGGTLVMEFNGTQLKSLADLEAAAAAVKDGDSLTFAYKDLSSADRSRRQRTVTAELKFWPLKAYEWSRSALDWVQVR